METNDVFGKIHFQECYLWEDELLTQTEIISRRKKGAIANEVQQFQKRQFKITEDWDVMFHLRQLADMC